MPDDKDRITIQAKKLRQTRQGLDRFKDGTGYPLQQPMTDRKWFWMPFRDWDDRITWERLKERHEAARRRANVDAHELLFKYNGRLMNRFEMMDHIIMMTYEGWELPRILDDHCDPTNIMPTPKEMHRWMELHPAFKEELEKARAYKGEVYNDLAIRTVMNISGRIDEEGKELPVTKEAINYAKMVSDLLMRQAAISNEKFQEKTKQQIQDVTERGLTPEQLEREIASLVKSNPELQQLLDQQRKPTIDDSTKDAEIIVEDK